MKNTLSFAETNFDTLLGLLGGEVSMILGFAGLMVITSNPDDFRTLLFEIVIAYQFLFLGAVIVGVLGISLLKPYLQRLLRTNR